MVTLDYRERDSDLLRESGWATPPESKTLCCIGLNPDTPAMQLQEGQKPWLALPVRASLPSCETHQRRTQNQHQHRSAHVTQMTCRVV